MSRTLSELFLIALGNPEQAPSAELQPALRERHLVLVCGFAQEGIFGYFSETRRCLKREFGNPKVSLVHLHSPRPPTENIEPLRTRLLELHQAGGGRPLLVIAHSQGGIVATACLMRHPELVREGIIERLVAVQAPYAGSLIADLVIQKIPFLGTFRGLSSLTTGSMKDFMKDELERFGRASRPEDRELLRHRIFFARSSKPAGASIFWPLRKAHRYLSLQGPNDGFLLENSQMLAGLGTDLGSVEADHTDLFYPNWMSSGGGLRKIAFTRALIQRLYGV